MLSLQLSKHLSLRICRNKCPNTLEQLMSKCKTRENVSHSPTQLATDNGNQVTWSFGIRVQEFFPFLMLAQQAVELTRDTLSLANTILISPLSEKNTERLLAQPGQPKVSPDVGHPLPVETTCLKRSPRQGRKLGLSFTPSSTCFNRCTPHFSANKNLVKNQIASRSLQETKKTCECIPGSAPNVLWQNVVHAYVWCDVVCAYLLCTQQLGS